jgi:hypothetical protein
MSANNVRGDDVIITCKPCRQALQHHATVHCHAADRSRARWAEATTQQDRAMLAYDPTGWVYATDRAPRGKTNGTGHDMCRPRHHYHVPVFNALASV